MSEARSDLRFRISHRDAKLGYSLSLFAIRTEGRVNKLRWIFDPRGILYVRSFSPMPSATLPSFSHVVSAQVVRVPEATDSAQDFQA